ncbi:MAG: hypothetical protein IPP08_04940 [Chlorobiota bacterium]|nr:hypothetical protein [Chlorobiota bacterium]QQS67515.1 MAG: hypothetical protein IPP08_04940 [Chlorobiota bacterium]
MNLKKYLFPQVILFLFILIVYKSEAKSIQDTFKITVTGALEFCEGGSVKLSAPLDCDSFIWSNGERTQSIIVKKTGSYSVTIFNYKGNGISITTDSVYVKVNQSPVVQIISSCIPILCPGDSIILYAVSNKNYSYKWNNGIIGNLLIVKTAGIYSVEVTDSNGCKGKAEIIVTQFQKNQTTIVSSSKLNSIAPGEVIKLTAYPSGLKYKWFNGDTTQSTNINSYGKYCIITYIDCSKPCRDTFCINISKRDTSIIRIHPSHDSTDKNGKDSIIKSGKDSIIIIGKDTSLVRLETICEGDSVYLISSNGFDNYLWNTGETSKSILVNKPGLYTVTGTTLSGFKSTLSILVKFIQIDIPVIKVIGNEIICTDELRTLEAPIGYDKYLWSDGSTSRSIITNKSGKYSVKVFKGFCSSTSPEVTLTSKQKPLYEISQSELGKTCLGKVIKQSIIIENKINEIQKYILLDNNSDRFKLITNEIVVPPFTKGTINYEFSGIDAEPGRIYKSLFVLKDECGGTQEINVSAVANEQNFSLYLSNQDTIARKPGIERIVFLLSNKNYKGLIFNSYDSIFINLSHENTTLELYKIISYCGNASFTLNKSKGESLVTLSGGCGILPDTLAKLIYSTAIGSTMNSVVRISSTTSNNSCFEFDTSSISIPLLQYDCEIKFLNINYSNPILKSVISESNSITVNYFIKSKDIINIVISDLVGNKKVLVDNKTENEGEYKINFPTYNYPAGLYIMSLSSSSENFSIPFLITH